MTCICGNCPAIRAARGLVPFCRLDRTVRTERPGFETAEEAEIARKPGQSVVGKRGGVGHGPMRFFLRGKAA